MPTFNHISGAEPSTVTFKAATVSFVRNSSVMHQELISLADPDNAANLAAILGAAPASTAVGLVVRAVGDSTSIIHGDSTVFQGTSPWAIAGNSSVWQGSTAWQVQVTNQARVTNSSASDFLVTISGNSTVAPLAGSLWTVQGNSTVAPLAGSTWNTRPIQSSAADLQVTATIGTNLQSTSAPSSNSSGLTVRVVVDNLLTTASTNAFASTSFTIQSSGAALRSYVTAYSILSTNQTPNKIAFYSSGVMLWPLVLAALSSAVSGVNLAVAPPGYLFRTIGAADALTLQTKGSAGGGYQVGVSYFRAP